MGNNPMCMPQSPGQPVVAQPPRPDTETRIASAALARRPTPPAIDMSSASVTRVPSPAQGDNIDATLDANPLSPSSERGMRSLPSKVMSETKRIARDLVSFNPTRLRTNGFKLDALLANPWVLILLAVGVVAVIMLVTAVGHAVMYVPPTSTTTTVTTVTTSTSTATTTTATTTSTTYTDTTNTQTTTTSTLTTITGTLTTTTRTLTTTTPLRVGISMIIQNVDYNGLVSDDIMQSEFEDAIKDAIVHEAGYGIPAADVSLALKPGSILVDALIDSKYLGGDEAASVQSALRSSKLGARAAALVGKVDRIMTVTTGEIFVTNLGTSLKRGEPSKSYSERFRSWVGSESRYVSDGAKRLSTNIKENPTTGRYLAVGVPCFFSALICILCCLQCGGRPTNDGYKPGREGGIEDSWGLERKWDEPFAQNKAFSPRNVDAGRHNRGGSHLEQLWAETKGTSDDTAYRFAQDQDTAAQDDGMIERRTPRGLQIDTRTDTPSGYTYESPDDVYQVPSPRERASPRGPAANAARTVTRAPNPEEAARSESPSVESEAKGQTSKGGFKSFFRTKTPPPSNPAPKRAPPPAIHSNRSPRGQRNLTPRGAV